MQRIINYIGSILLALALIFAGSGYERISYCCPVCAVLADAVQKLPCMDNAQCACGGSAKIHSCQEPGCDTHSYTHDHSARNRCSAEFVKADLNSPSFSREDFSEVLSVDISLILPQLIHIEQSIVVRDLYSFEGRRDTPPLSLGGRALLSHTALLLI